MICQIYYLCKTHVKVKTLYTIYTMQHTGKNFLLDKEHLYLTWIHAAPPISFQNVHMYTHASKDTMKSNQENVHVCKRNSTSQHTNNSPCHHFTQIKTMECKYLDQRMKTQKVILESLSHQNTLEKTHLPNKQHYYDPPLNKRHH